MRTSRSSPSPLRPLVLLALALIVVGGSAGLAAAAGTFRIAVGVEPDTLDPVQMTTTTVANMVDYVVETLTFIDQDGKIRPMLAESWSSTPDGVAYTFRLRKGVMFQDGTPLNAQAVKWNLDRLKDPAVRVPIRAPYPIDKVDAVDASTVRVTLTRPSAPFVSALSWTTAAIISPASADKHGNEYKNIVHPVGTGPYMFTERKKGESLTVTQYDKYWGRKPHYDTVVFRIVPEAATRESLLLAGQVELIVLPPVADLPALSQNPAVKVVLAPSDRTIFIAINTTKPPFTDPRVRQALNYAVDKGAIIQSVLFGAADPMDAPMAPSLFGYCKVGAYEFNQAKAKELLAATGVKPGTKVSFIHPTGRYVQDKEASQAIAGYLREVGLEPQIQTMDWPSYVRTIITPADKGNTTELHYLGWAPAFLDAAQQVLQFLSTYAPPSGLATTFYKDPRVDELIQAADREANPDKRRELYCQISKKVWADAPWIFLYVQRYPIVYSAKVTDVGSIPNEKFYAVYARPAQ
ncbi:MAG: ABC transporter substrate-binding protein [Candidatus Rokubacteria bacterium]|nr:ABC transporter substrate-binding protein [Candidatus Rokubacteria bacterium]